MIRVLPYILILILGLFNLMACKSAEEDEDDSSESSLVDIDKDAEVNEPAIPILENEGSLFVFSIREFKDEVNLSDPSFDEIAATIDEFAITDVKLPAEEDAPVEDKGANLLPYSRESWEEIYQSGSLIQLEWDEVTPFEYEWGLRRETYRVIDGELTLRRNSFFKPTYQRINDNVYETRQEAIYVWDFGDIDAISTEEDLSGEDIADWESIKLYGENFTILENASTWAADDSVQNKQFRSGAKLYAATRNIVYEDNTDIVVIEAIFDGVNKFELDTAKVDTSSFTTAPTSLQELITGFPDSAASDPSIEFEFSYSHIQNVEGEKISPVKHVINGSSFSKPLIQFNTASQKADLFTNTSSTELDRVTVPYSINLNEGYVELDITSLTRTQLQSFNLPGNFNIVIAGPFGDTDNFYYGKKYLRTQDEDAQREKLEPVFFLNEEAIEDVKNAFEDYRRMRNDQDEIIR